MELPPTINKCQDLNELLSTIYPQLEVAGRSNPIFLTERIILSARNDDVSAINTAALDIFPGEKVTYLAADKMCADNECDRSITNRYPNEYLNSLDPNGLPPFQLELKVGCPIMLLRNISPKQGMCNGTRLIVVRCKPCAFVIETNWRKSRQFGLYTKNILNTIIFGISFSNVTASISHSIGVCPDH